ncbi:hypothetical protein AHAS_Ahas17G0255500 [Arachis hypogaea]
MIDGLAMEVRDGRLTRFWKDTWLQSEKLKDSFPELYLISNDKGSMIAECGFWDGIECKTDSLNQMLDTLQDVRLVADAQDRVVWKFDKECVYNTNSFVQVL